MDVQKIASLIAKLRKEKGLTQKQLAQQFGISDKSVSKWERAETMPDISLLPEIAAFFGISVDRLLEGDREEKVIEDKSAHSDEGLSEYKAFSVKNIIGYIIADVIIVVAIVIWAITCYFTDNGWRNVTFFGALLIYFIIVIVSFILNYIKSRPLISANYEKQIKRDSYILFGHCVAGGVIFVICTDLFSGVKEILAASIVIAGILTAFLCYINKDKKLVRFFIRYKIGALLPAVVISCLCLFVPFFVIVTQEPYSEIKITLINALSDSLGLKGTIPFFLLFIFATVYTTVAVCKNLPAWSISAIWTVLAILSVILCQKASYDLCELYNTFKPSAGIIKQVTVPFLLYGSSASLVFSIIFHIIYKIRKSKS